MVLTDLQALRRQYKKDNNLIPIRAVLGNGNGQVKVRPGIDDSLVYVRLRQGEGFGVPTTAYNEASIVEAPGAPVILGYNENEELVVLKSDRVAAQQAGYNPGFNNAADGAGNWLDPELWPQAATFPIDTSNVQGLQADTSLSIGAFPLRYLWGTDWYDFPGDVVDLTSLLPTAGNWRMALVYIDENNDLSATGSTEQTLELDPLDITDAQEAFSAASDLRIPLSWWVLTPSMSSIINSDKWSDARQFIAATAAGGGGGATGCDFLTPQPSTIGNYTLESSCNVSLAGPITVTGVFEIDGVAGFI